MRKSRNTKGRIVSAAWRLFYDQGYDNTTVDEIILESGTSKGSFYHYFEGKDALLSSLSYLFDEKYETLVSEMNTDMESFDKLIYLNQELFAMIEDSISIDLLARLYSSQLVTRGKASFRSFSVLLSIAQTNHCGRTSGRTAYRYTHSQ